MNTGWRQSCCPNNWRGIKCCFGLTSKHEAKKKDKSKMGQ